LPTVIGYPGCFLRFQVIEQRAIRHAISYERHAQRVRVTRQVNERELYEVVACGDRHILASDPLILPHDIRGADGCARECAVFDLLPGILRALRDADACVDATRGVIQRPDKFT
jgi:hypothetical protein